MSAINDMLKEIKELRPMPKVASQIMAIVEEPNSSISDLADLVIYDPSLTAMILKTCNSAYFALPRKVDSVQEAISLLGMDQIVDLVLLKGGAENLKTGHEGYGLHEGELWRQSVASALIARELAEKKGSGQKHLVFTAALLKDIGKVILDRYVGDSFHKIIQLVEKKDFSFREAEKRVIGIDHAELGGIVAKMWEFSPKMIEIIANHHLSDASGKDDLETGLVYIADTVCMMMGIGGGADGLAYRFHKDVLDRMKVSPMDLQEIIASFGEKLKKVEDLIQVV